jgi:hypothetical protein
VKPLATLCFARSSRKRPHRTDLTIHRHGVGKCFGDLAQTEIPAVLASVLLEQSPFQGTYASSASQIFRYSGITLVSKTTFEVFTRAGPDNSLERLTERSVGLVTDRPSNVYELFVTLL